jgi:hypothetical protein
MMMTEIYRIITNYPGATIPDIRNFAAEWKSASEE